MELDLGESRKNRHLCCWKNAMARHEPLILH